MKKFIRNLCKKPEEEDPIKKIEIYSYQFPDGKAYVGYTSHGLEQAEWFHQSFSSNPIFQHVHNFTVIKPRLKKTVMTRLYGDEIYKHMREVMDKCGFDPQCLLNRNLKLYGYDVSKLKSGKIRRVNSN